MFCLSRQKRFAKGCKGQLGFDLLKQKSKVSKSYLDELDFLWSNTMNRNKVASKKMFFWGDSNAQSFKTAFLGGGFHFSNRKHATPKQQKEGDRKDEGEKKQGNKKENHICQTVSKNKKANASRTFSLLAHLKFTCAFQL